MQQLLSSKNVINWSPLNQDIQILFVIYQLRNISKASPLVGLSQANISKILIHLESKIGEKLFTRTRNGVIPTDYCHQLIQALQKIENLWKLVSKDLLNLADQLAPVITLGCHQSIGINLLPQFFKEINDLYVHTEFHVQFDKSTEITRQVSQRDLDIGLVINPIKNTDLVIKPIATDFIALWGHEASNSLLMQPDLFLGEKILRQFKHKKILKIKDYEIIAEMIGKNKTCGLLPSSIAERHNLPLISGKLFTANLKLICHKDFLRKPAHKKLINEILNSIVSKN